MSNTDASVDFLRWWAPEGPWVLTAIATDRKSTATRTFRPETETALRSWLAQESGRRNVYFQVNPPLRDLSKKALKEDVAALAWLHVDIDPRAGEDIAEEQERALNLLRNPPGEIPPPSAIVFSGGGYQGFWRLSDPVELNGVVERAEDAERYNQALELAFGADHCHNVDRIMRLPGTMNIPDEKKRKKGRVETLATTTELHDDRVYPLSAFVQAPAVQLSSGGGLGFASGSATRVEVTGNVARLLQVDELNEWNVPDRVKVIVVQGHHPDETKARDNSRSAWLFDAVCQLVRCGVPDQVIFSVITDPDFGISESVLDKGQNAEKYAIRQIENAKEDAIHPRLREFNERFAIIGNIGGQCKVIEEVMDPVVNRAILSRQSFTDFRNRYSRELISVPDAAHPGQVKYARAGKWWLEHPQARYFDRVIFSPQGDKTGCYNLWRGFAVKSTPGALHQIFLDHTRDIICNGDEELYSYVIRWLARAVQQPWLPGEVAIVLRSGEGTGKSRWVTWIMDLFGRHALQVSNPSHLVGNFNSHLRDCAFLFADEAFYAGDKRHESTLKTLITERDIMIEGKGQDAEQHPNYIHLIMASNSVWVVPAGMDARRYLVLDVNETRKDDRAYFQALMDARAGGGLEHLLHYLLTLDLSGFEVRSVPKTAALSDQKVYSMSPEDEWWYGKLVAGAVLPHHTRWEREVRCEDLCADYVEHTKAVGVLRRASPTVLGRFLGKCLPEGYPRAMQRIVREETTTHDGFRDTSSPRRVRYYELPSLEACRARFVERFQFVGEWVNETFVDVDERSEERDAF